MPDRTGPFNVISGRNLNLPPPNITGSNYSAIAIYNYGAYPQLVQYGSKTDIIQPYSANGYPIAASNYSVSVTPIDDNALGTYEGTVYGVWYLPNETLPPFPIPLTSPPNGSVLVAHIVSGTFTLALPPGCGQLTFAPLGIVPGLSLTIDGVQGEPSGNQYILSAPSGLVNPLTIPIAPQFGDSTVKIVTAGANCDIYASAGGGIPQAATNIAQATCTGAATPILGSPAQGYGAFYIFGANAFILAAGNSAAIFDAALGRPIASNSTGALTNAGWVPLLGESLPYRAPNGISGVNNTAGGQAVAVAYAFGP